ncbi:MAG: O-antigen ligase family protein [Actinomycetota bacterium]|nr:O-antigen ligase family protein [Actinomycetota bacterium]
MSSKLAGLGAGLGLLVVGVALALGTTMPVSPLPALSAAVGLAMLPLILRHAGVALVVFVSVVVTELSGVVGERGPLGLYSLTLLLVAASLLHGLRRREITLPWSPVFLYALFFLAALALSVFVARDISGATIRVLELAGGMVTLFVVAILLNSTRRYITTAKVAVVLLTGLAGLSLVQEFVLHNSTTFGGLSNVPVLTADVGGTTARHSGPLRDANYWAQHLVLFIPLALSFAAHSRSVRAKLMWGGALAVLGGGLYLTQSRGGILSLGLVIIVWLLSLGRRYARWLIAMPAVLLVLMLTPGVGSRLMTLADLREARSGGGDASLVQRTDVQEAGLAMFLDHATVGVGAGNFSLIEPEYARRLGLAHASPLAPHNLYLEMAAEAGVLGLTTWLLFYGCAMFVAVRALVLLRRLDPSPTPSLAVLLAAGLVAGLAGWALTSLFLHLVGLRPLLVVIGFAAALDLDTRERSGLPANLFRPSLPAPAGGPALAR